MAEENKTPAAPAAEAAPGGAPAAGEGKRVKRKDTPGKVTGAHPYVHQLRLPGMLHGRVVRPRGQGPYGVIDKPLASP